MSGDQVIAIIQTDVPTPAGVGMQAQAIDAALMLTTPQWIPVDSAYEAAVAASLVAEGRRFEKPMRFDAGEDQVFPDFWLKDVGEAFPLEVWGMTDSDYLARKVEKTAHYDGKYGADRWWQWDAAAGAPIPPFPTLPR